MQNSHSYWNERFKLDINPKMWRKTLLLIFSVRIFPENCIPSAWNIEFNFRFFTCSQWFTSGCCSCYTNRPQILPHIITLYRNDDIIRVSDQQLCSIFQFSLQTNASNYFQWNFIKMCKREICFTEYVNIFCVYKS